MTVASILSSELLLKLDRLRLTPRQPLTGPQRGELRSRQYGASLEFADYREYMPGDDERRIDWHVLARTDEVYVRLFTGEENLRVDVLVDQSLSMDFGRPSKLAYARSVAAALGYVALRQGHQVTVLSFADAVESQSPPMWGRGGTLDLFRFLGALEPGGTTSLQDALGQRSIEHPHPGMTFILSDLYDAESWTAGLKALRAAGRAVYVFHVLSPEELNPTTAGAFEWIDAESSERLHLEVDGDALALYRETLDQWLDALRSQCREVGVTYILTPTETPLERFLLLTLRREGVWQ